MAARNTNLVLAIFTVVLICNLVFIGKLYKNYPVVLQGWTITSQKSVKTNIDVHSSDTEGVSLTTENFTIGNASRSHDFDSQLQGLDNEEFDSEMEISTTDVPLGSPDCKDVKEFPRFPSDGKPGKLRQQFVIPTYKQAGGPGSFYNMYRWTLQFAVANRLGIVTHDFQPHAFQETDIDTPRRFDQTFDTDALNELLPTLPVEDFYDMCNGGIEKGNLIAAVPRRQYKTEWCTKYQMRMCEDDVVSNKGAIKFMANYFKNISFPDVHKNYATFREDVLRGDPPQQCLAFRTSDANYTCMTQIEALVEKYLVRAPYIRRLALEGGEKLCHGNYAVMHWRNKSAEYSVQCTEKNKDCKEKRVPQNLQLLQEAAPIIVREIESTMKREKLSCLYVATPVYAQTIGSYLSAADLRVYYAEDLIKMAPSLRKYEHDNYALSLIEQEMAERAQLFFSSRTSNWSMYVEYTRHMRKKKTVSVRDLPGIPQELLDARFLL